MRTYDPSQVIINFSGVQLSGFADGTFITASRRNDMFTMVVGADGESSRSKTNDFSGEVVLTLKATSPSNDILSSLATLDELSNSGVKPLTISDKSGRTILFSGTAWLRKQAEVEFGMEVGDREWNFDCGKIALLVGGNPTSDGEN